MALETVTDVVQAGAEILVAGSAVFGPGDILAARQTIAGSGAARKIDAYMKEPNSTLESSAAPASSRVSGDGHVARQGASAAFSGMLEGMTNGDTAATREKCRNILTGTAFVGFAVNGIVTVILGPILPVLIARWTLSDGQVAWFFPTQFIGSWLGTVVSSAVIARKGYRLPIGIGYAMLGLGVAGLTYRRIYMGRWRHARFRTAMVSVTDC